MLGCLVVLHQSGSNPSLGAGRIPALFASIWIERRVLASELNAVVVTRRAQHVLARPLCDVATLQRVQAHGAVARDASVPRESGCSRQGHVRSIEWHHSKRAQQHNWFRAQLEQLVLFKLLQYCGPKPSFFHFFSWQKWWQKPALHASPLVWCWILSCYL